jgi:hypothetical protein
MDYMVAWRPYSGAGSDHMPSNSLEAITIDDYLKIDIRHKSIIEFLAEILNARGGAKV